MQHTVYTIATYWLWAGLMLVWFIGFFGNKRTAKREGTAAQWFVLITAGLGSAMLFAPGRFTGWLAAPAFVPGNILGWIGVVCSALGVAVAVWARLTIGRNWSGALVTVKEKHELVRTGPYALVRHPIYTGFLLTALGTALTLGYTSSILGFVLLATALVSRIPREERFMSELFPQEYPAYKARTKTLIPFLF